MQTVIEVQNLEKSFKEKIALNQINFTIKKGEIFGFLGLSGSGKTTTINILTNQLLADAGSSYVLNVPSKDIGPKELKKMGIVSDNNGYYGKLTLYKNPQLYAKIYQTSKNELDDLLRDVELYDHRKTVAEKLSNGQKQRMFLIRALIKKPKILFLDEPTSGLDPKTTLKIHHILKKLKDEGVTIFLTTHDMNEATKLCDQLILLHNGNIVAKGAPKMIINEHNVDQQLEIKYRNGLKKKVSLKDAKAQKDVFLVHNTY